MTAENSNQPSEKKESVLLSLLFNIALPALILSKMTKMVAKVMPDVTLSPVFVLLFALAFPVTYFIVDYVKRRNVNWVSILGFVSIFLTGIIGVFEFPSEWIAYKEASVPFIIGLALLLSIKFKYPLIRKFLYNKELIDVDMVDGILEEKNAKERFDQILVNSTYMLALSFVVSTILNFTLAKLLIHSPSGTEAFNQELGKMTALSYPVIALPSTIVMMFAMWYLIHNIKKITGLTMEQMLAPQLREKFEEEEKKEKEKQGE